MTYVGQQPATTFDSGIQDRFTGLTTNTVTLNHEISAEEDILVVWNNIVQDKNTYSVGGTGNKTQRLVSICKKLKATHYLSGESARNYILGSEFSDQNIELEYQEYQHPEYPQRYEGFVPFLSTIDLLFNCGEKSLGILKQPVPHCN